MTGPDHEIIVIGSGPAGIAAARALLDGGKSVTLVDSGRTLPPEAQAMRDELAATSPQAWDRKRVTELNRHSLQQRGGVPLKTVFGSDFAYDPNPSVEMHDASLLASQARGGLSTAWGAAILPLSKRDMQGWPLTPDDLAPHYRAVLEWLPHAQQHDDLASDYPLHSETGSALKLSTQGAALERDLHQASESLLADRIRCGRSRLAVGDCVHCGQCLHGCPYQLIYTSSDSLDALESRPGFRYLSDHRVTALEEQTEHVQVRADHGGNTITLTAGRVIVATGVLNTALLLMPLLRLDELTLRDSAYELAPFLRYGRDAGIGTQPHFTLSQFFMELDLPEVSSRNVHLQWYGYNDFYAMELDKTLGPLRALVPDALKRQLTERLWSIQGFLHSDDSPSLQLTLTANGRARLSVADDSRAAHIFAAVYRRLNRHSGALKGRVLPPLRRRGIPGGSFHSGASLPMQARPAEGQSDLLGRPHGLQRTHSVDSSVFPNIASSTITLSVMANAHRIGTAIHQQF